VRQDGVWRDEGTSFWKTEGIAGRKDALVRVEPVKHNTMERVFMQGMRGNSG